MPDQTMQNRKSSALREREREKEKEKEKERKRERNYAWTIIFQFNLGHG